MGPGPLVDLRSEGGPDPLVDLRSEVGPDPLVDLRSEGSWPSGGPEV